MGRAALPDRSGEHGQRPVRQSTVRCRRERRSGDDRPRLLSAAFPAVAPAVWRAQLAAGKVWSASGPLGPQTPFGRSRRSTTAL